MSTRAISICLALTTVQRGRTRTGMNEFDTHPLPTPKLAQNICMAYMRWIHDRSCELGPFGGEDAICRQDNELAGMIIAGVEELLHRPDLNGALESPTHYDALRGMTDEALESSPLPSNLLERLYSALQTPDIFLLAAEQGFDVPCESLLDDSSRDTCDEPTASCIDIISTRYIDLAEHLGENSVHGNCLAIRSLTGGLDRTR